MIVLYFVKQESPFILVLLREWSLEFLFPNLMYGNITKKIHLLEEPEYLYMLFYLSLNEVLIWVGDEEPKQHWTVPPPYHTATHPLHTHVQSHMCFCVFDKANTLLNFRRYFGCLNCQIVHLSNLSRILVCIILFITYQFLMGISGL